MVAKKVVPLHIMKDGRMVRDAWVTVPGSKDSLEYWHFQKLEHGGLWKSFHRKVAEGYLGDEVLLCIFTRFTLVFNKCWVHLGAFGGLGGAFCGFLGAFCVVLGAFYGFLGAFCVFFGCVLKVYGCILCFWGVCLRVSGCVWVHFELSWGMDCFCGLCP